MPSSRRSGSSTPTPRGNTTEGQLRLVFRQVMRNGAMGLDQAVFVGSHFGVDSVSMRKTFKEVAKSAALDEEEFLDLMQRAMSRCKIMDEANRHWPNGVKPSVMHKHQATLHKEMSVLPYVSTNRKPYNMAVSPSPAPGKDISGDLSHNSPEAKKFLSQSADADMLNRSLLNCSTSPQGTFSRPASRLSTAGKPRAASVPPMGESPNGVERPGSAKYLRPYTPQGSDQSPVRWNKMDNNVPRNVRTVLLRPIRVFQRPVTPQVPDEKLNQLLVRATDSLKGITRMEAIDAFTSCSEPTVSQGLITISAARNGLQTMGFNATLDDVRMLAKEEGALSDDGEMVKFHTLTSSLIPVVETLTVEEAGIHPEKFHKFKQQRLAFTKNLSTKEIKLLHILRAKLNHTCLGGASELRKSFKHFDTKGTGKSTLRQMVQALALQGIGMAPSDAEVLYSILDPDGKEGLDYNEFTALMMPPDMEDAFKETVHLGYDFRASRSRAGARDRNAKQGARARKGPAKPDPEAVLRFLRSLSTDQVLQVLRNKVALALKAGPGAIRKLYQLFDKDGNNEIDEFELRDLLVDFGLSLSPQQITKLMQRLDRNFNGLLDQHEFVTALLPQEHYSLAASQADLKDSLAVGVSPENSKLSGDDLREFLREKLLRTFVKKGETSPGYQIREAISRFDLNRDGSMSSYELRKAMNALGLYVDDSTVQTLIKCYDADDTGSAEFLRFVEDIDPHAFNYAFSVGKVAMAGSFESVEKEAKISPNDPDQKVRNTLKAALRKRMKVDGMSSVLKEIRAYGMTEGKMTRENFRAALLRLGLKIENDDNLRRAFDVFCDGNGSDSLDVYRFAAAADADFEMLPKDYVPPDRRNEKKEDNKNPRSRLKTGGSVRGGSSLGAAGGSTGGGGGLGSAPIANGDGEGKVTKSPTIVKPGPFVS